MSAPAALRAPAGTWRVARHYLGMLKYDSVVWGLLVGMLIQSGRDDGMAFGGVAGSLPLLFFLPLGQWSVAEGRAALDAAMPLDRVRHKLIRVACGAVSASVTLAAALVVVYLLSRFDPWFPVPVKGAKLVQYPGWYSLALFAAGLTWYLLGSAVLLRAERPGRVFVLLTVLFQVVLAWLPPGAWESLILVHQDPAELAALGPAEWLGGAALPLGLAWAAVYAAVRLDLPRIHEPARALARLGRGLRRPAAPAAAPPGGPRRPSSVAVVAWRHVLLLRHRMAWPVLVSLFLACGAARAALDAGGEAPGPVLPDWFISVAFFWPVLVWMDERGRQREQNEALPVGTTRRRILHAAAGAAWLLLVFLLPLAGRLGGALAAGALAWPVDVSAMAWLEIPYSVSTLYLLGTFVTVLSRHPVRDGIFALPVATFITLVGPFGPLNPSQAEWNVAGAASWLLLCAAAAAAALALAVRRDRDGRFPRMGEVLRFARASARAAAAGRPA